MARLDKARWQKRITELHKKKFIDSDQKESLTNMLKSEDEENGTMVEVIAKRYIYDTLALPLNDGQKKAFHNIIEAFKETNYKPIVIKGYAGTGKTFLVKRVIEYIIQTEENSKIAITAPTNKAVKVLYNNSAAAGNGYLFEDVFDSKSRLVYSTIHKLLSFKEVIRDDGTVTFETDSLAGLALDDYKYVFIDETSMLVDQLTQILMARKKVKLIFLGDPCQIPQIGKEECMPFSPQHKHLFQHVVLDEIMRQKGDNAIIAASMDIRSALNEQDPLPHLTGNIVNAKDEGIVMFNSNTEKTKIRPLIETFIKDKKYQASCDYFKILAWKNETVRYINSVCREVLYGYNPPRFVVGERLISQKPIFEKVVYEKKGKKYENWRVLVPNSEEMELEHINIGTIRVDGYHPLVVKAYELTVSYIDHTSDNKTVRSVIKVVHEDDQYEYEQYLRRLKDIAIARSQSFLWVNYYNALKLNADINYNYGLSVHKSQGSTYENVLLLEDDLNANNKVVERNRIKYTAYTRASKKLFVLKAMKLVKEAYKDYRTEDYTSCGPT